MDEDQEWSSGQPFDYRVHVVHIEPNMSLVRDRVIP